MTGYVDLDVTLRLFLQLGRATYCVLRVLVCTVYWFKECGLYTERCLGLSDYGVGQSENSHHQTGVLSQKGNANGFGSWKFEVASSGSHAPSSKSVNYFVCYIARFTTTDHHLSKANTVLVHTHPVIALP